MMRITRIEDLHIRVIRVIRGFTYLCGLGSLCFAFLQISCAPPPPPGPPATTQPLATPRELPGLPDFAQVSPILYRGGQPTPMGFEQLKQMGIKTIVDLRGKSHRDNFGAMRFNYVQIPSSVSHPDEHQIFEFLRIVRQSQNQPVFVHDDLGGDRVGLYVAAYRMVEQGWTGRDVEAELPRFHFDKYWTQIPAFLEKMDVSGIREELGQPASTQNALTTRAAG